MQKAIDHQMGQVRSVTGIAPRRASRDDGFVRNGDVAKAALLPGAGCGNGGAGNDSTLVGSLLAAPARG